MKRVVQSDPENVYVASGYKEIGKSFDLQRQRVTNVVYSISRASTEEQGRRIDELVGTDGITDAEKPALARELDSIIRDFDYLSTDTANADLIDSDEFVMTRQAYDTLVELMSRIVNSVGTYTNSDVNMITVYYADYTTKAIALQNLILSTTSELDRINAYYAMTKVNVSAYPEAIPVNQTSVVSATITYEGVDKTSYVSADSIVFGVVNLASGTTSSMITVNTTLYPHASVQLHPITNSAEIMYCKEFTIAYDAIGAGGIAVKCEVTLDSGSMPF